MSRPICLSAFSTFFELRLVGKTFVERSGKRERRHQKTQLRNLFKNFFMAPPF